METSVSSIANTVKAGGRVFLPMLLVAFALMVGGCGDSEEAVVPADSEVPATDTTPILIAAGNDSRAKIKVDAVYQISGMSTLRQMYQRVTGVSDLNWSTTDFKTRVMYGIQLKPTKGGESVDIHKIEQGDGEVILHGYRTNAGPKCPLSKKTTTPYAVYETGPKRGTPRLELTDAVGSTCDGR